jgi:hypothetical protein
MPAAAAGAFRYPLVTVHLAAKTMPSPGSLEATLHVSVCVSHVSAYAVNLSTGQILQSTEDRGSGETARVAFSVGPATSPGRFELAGVFAGRAAARAAPSSSTRPAGTSRRRSLSRPAGLASGSKNSNILSFT